jgi:endonuclease I
MNQAALKLVTLTIILLALVSPALSDVLISEMCDPRDNYLSDRFIEIYNSGTETVSLDGWSLTCVANSAEVFTWNLSGSILPGDALVCGDLTTSDTFTVDFPEAAWSSNNGNWNGKTGDGARLYNASHSLIDDTVVSATVFENDDLVRNENITTPGTSFNFSEWTATAVDLPSEGTPGSHFAPPPVVGPAIENVVTNPVTPLAGDTVFISSDVTDTEATITDVTLDWGLSSGSLTNSVTMTLSAGNTYTAASPIPGQAAGSTVYYTITATNDSPASNTTAILNYSLAWIVTIQDIQGTGLTSPHVGHEVITSGTVTAGSGGTWVIQDGTGSRSGLWINGVSVPTLGTEVTVQGVVAEMSGNTTLSSTTILSSVAGSMPAAAVVTTGTAVSEDYEGVLVQVVSATCTVSDPTNQQWYLNNGGASARVDEMWTSYVETLGSVYTVTGPVSGNTGFSGIIPRSGSDIVFVNDPTAPAITGSEAQGPTSVVVTFSEALNEASAENTANYSVTGSMVTGASVMAGTTDMVMLTTTYLTTGSHTLTIDGVADLAGNATSNAVSVFQFYGGNVPVGYYNPAIGLNGEDLRLALHNVIDGHSSVSYTYLWTAFYSTDAKPDGTVWDMYSDVPGGTPPYIYEFGIDQTGSGATEGTGYNREHSWPQSWYGGASPMYTDLFVLYPTDTRVNGYRSNYAFGEVSNPTITSWNGCKVGSNTYPGYSGTVFEPLDEYKGDFARAYFYMSVRYYTEDGSWANLSPMSNRSQLLPWAEDMLIEWHISDPVSQKEIDRNDAVYDIQNNRNPFIDRPDFVSRVFTPELSAVPGADTVVLALLHQNVPNPFNPSTTISYELQQDGPVQLEVYDVAGRLVSLLVQQVQAEGSYEMVWHGRDVEGRMAPTGIYFYRLTAGGESQTRRMLLVK